MNTENQKTIGQVRLESYRLVNKWDKFLVALMNFFKLDPTNYVRLHGLLKWDTGFNRNTITSAGKAAEASRMGGLGAAAFIYVAVGSSNTAPAVGQTALVSEYSTIGLSRASVTPTQITTNVSNDTLQLQKTFSVSGSGTVEEMGIFNAASGPTMLGRGLTGSKVLVSGDQLIATYQVIYN